MKVTESIHALEISFKVPVAPEINVDRIVYVYFVFGKKITLIDSGVAGAESIIFDCITKNGRDPHEISTLILSHSHPDHIGSARIIKEATDCRVLCHPAEKNWVEDVERQAQERPVPGFDSLVGGSISVDDLLQDGDLLEIEEDRQCKVIHTPGHSAGSISLFFEDEKALFSGDALPVPGDLPVYDDIATCVASINSLKKLEGIKILLSSWEPPIQGKDQINQRIVSSITYLQKIHNAVLSTHEKNKQTGMALCKQVVANLGLPPFVANPLLVKAFTSSLVADKNAHLFKF
ncbi:MAG: MBL fold metallo-hydrolase [Desulfobacteraceae bacterium]|nr:MAG: MBL fold metallo-hydrolase [Desulfobacteraceae bacterium]